MVTLDASAPAWAHDFARKLADEMAILRGVPSFSRTQLPKASLPVRVIFVPDEIGGAVLAFNDGTVWRRVTDRAQVV